MPDFLYFIAAMITAIAYARSKHGLTFGKRVAYNQVPSWFSRAWFE